MTVIRPEELTQLLHLCKQNNNVIFRQIYEVFLDFFKVDCSECIEQA